MNDIDEYLGALPAELSVVGRTLQTVIDAELPGAKAGLDEAGLPTWWLDGEPVVQLRAYSAYLRMCLPRGQALDDEDGALRHGDGEEASIDFSVPEDIDAPRCKRWLGQVRALPPRPERRAQATATTSR